MARRGENIHKRKDGRWEARYIKGRDNNGKIQYGYVYAHKYADVKDKKNQIMQSMKSTDQAVCKPIEFICFEELFDIWKRKTFPTVKKSSYCFYETVIDHHLCPYWGKTVVSQISEQSIQTFISIKIEESLSVSYINTILSIFKKTLKFAFQYGYLTTAVPTFQPLKQRKTAPDIFNLTEWTSLSNYLLSQNDNFSFGILICMYTGMRIGELCGLKWGDFDQISGQFMIKRTVYRTKNTEYTPGSNLPKTVVDITLPKTPSSIREIPLPEFLCKKVRQYSGSPSNYILTESIKFMEPRMVQKEYKKILEKCGIRYLNFHSLRHSFASIGISKGFDCKTLSEILGHSSVNITLNTYVHSSIERKRKCIELLVSK